MTMKKVTDKIIFFVSFCFVALGWVLYFQECERSNLLEENLRNAYTNEDITNVQQFVDSAYYYKIFYDLASRQYNVRLDTTRVGNTVEYRLIDNEK